MGIILTTGPTDMPGFEPIIYRQHGDLGGLRQRRDNVRQESPHKLRKVPLRSTSLARNECRTRKRFGHRQTSKTHPCQTRLPERTDGVRLQEYVHTEAIGLF